MGQGKARKAKKVVKSNQSKERIESVSNDTVVQHEHETGDQNHENQDPNDEEEAHDEAVFAAANARSKKKTQQKPKQRIDTTGFFVGESQQAEKPATSEQSKPLAATATATTSKKKNAPKKRKDTKPKVIKVRVPKGNKATSKPSKPRAAKGSGPGRGARLTLNDANYLLQDYQTKKAGTGGQQQGSTTRKSAETEDAVIREVKSAWDRTFPQRASLVSIDKIKEIVERKRNKLPLLVSKKRSGRPAGEKTLAKRLKKDENEQRKQAAVAERSRREAEAAAIQAPLDHQSNFLATAAAAVVKKLDHFVNVTIAQTGMISLFKDEAEKLFERGKNLTEALDTDIQENPNGISFETAVMLEKSFNVFVEKTISCEFSEAYYRERRPSVELRHLKKPHGPLPDQINNSKTKLRRTRNVHDMIGTSSELNKSSKSAIVASAKCLIRAIDLLNEGHKRKDNDYQRPSTKAHQRAITERTAEGHPSEALSVPAMSQRANPAPVPPTSESSSSTSLAHVSPDLEQVQRRIDTVITELVNLCSQRYTLEARDALRLTPSVITSALPSGILLVHTSQPGMNTSFTGAEVSVDEPHGDELIALHRAMHGVQGRDESNSYVNMKYPRYKNQIGQGQCNHQHDSSVPEADDDGDY